MTTRVSRGWKLTGLLLAGASLVWLSVQVRTETAHEPPDVAEPIDAAWADRQDPPTGAVLIDLDDDAGAADLAEVGARVDAAIAPYDWPDHAAALGAALSGEAQLYRVNAPASEIDDVLESLRGHSDVEEVEVERSWSLPEAIGVSVNEGTEAPADDPDRGPYRPNDPYYRYQWHMDQIQMPQAWNRTKGRGVVVAVIDTGVLYRDSGRFRRAPDLAQTRFVAGYDFVDNDRTPDDEHGHGTHCAGTIAQSTNNGVGVTGVAPEVSIMPIRVLDANGSGSWGALASSIRWAADNGAHVISMSLGGPVPSRTVGRAIEYAHGKGVTVIAAAGNASRARVDYPGAYPHVVAVGAVRYDETLSFYSSYGRGLDVVAPGGDTRVDQNGDGMPDGVVQNTMVRGNPSRHDYLAWQGTSMATPHVAGIAALLRASGVRDPDTIERILKRSAKAKSDTKRYGAGLVQADSALRMAEQGLGGVRGAAAIGIGLLMLFGLRRRQKLDVKAAPAIGIAALVAGVLAVLPWHWLGSAGYAAADVATGLPALTPLLGDWIAPVILSALVPFGAIALFLGVPRLRPLVVGLGLGVGALLMVEAVIPTASAFLALPSWIAGPWLVVNAAVSILLAYLAARKR